MFLATAPIKLKVNNEILHHEQTQVVHQVDVSQNEEHHI